MSPKPLTIANLNHTRVILDDTGVGCRTTAVALRSPDPPRKAPMEPTAHQVELNLVALGLEQLAAHPLSDTSNELVLCAYADRLRALAGPPHALDLRDEVGEVPAHVSGERFVGHHGIFGSR